MNSEQARFIQNWILPKEEIIRREKLIKDEICNWKNSTRFAEKVLEKRPYQLLIELCSILATLKPISDRELLDYLTGIFGLPFCFKEKDKIFCDSIDKLMKPAQDHYSRYISSEIYQSILVDREVAGDEILEIGKVIIPLSKQAVMKHISRVNALPLIPEDIAKIQKDLVDYKRKQFIDDKTKDIENYEILASKSDVFKEKVAPYGFFQLQMVSKLNQEGCIRLISTIIQNKAPYAIAMFEHIGFITHLMRAYFPKLKERDSYISRLLGTDERLIRGNINSLSPNTTEDRTRYTSYSYIEKVKKDYQDIKKEYSLKMP